MECGFVSGTSLLEYELHGKADVKAQQLSLKKARSKLYYTNFASLKCVCKCSTRNCKAAQ